MPTDKQIEANRRNAKKSTGPRTTEGKGRSALNALRHGLTAQVSVMPEEERVAFEAFTTPLIETFKPANPVETQLAVLYATYQWRLNRIAAIEEGLFALGTQENHLALDHPETHTALANAITFSQSPKSFEHLSLYSNRLLAQSEKALKRLKELQAERKALEAKDLAEAALIQRYLEAEGLPFDPAENGFLFSPAEIQTYVARQSLLERAKRRFTSRKAAA